MAETPSSAANRSTNDFIREAQQPEIRVQRVAFDVGQLRTGPISPRLQNQFREEKSQQETEQQQEQPRDVQPHLQAPNEEGDTNNNNQMEIQIERYGKR